MPRAFSLIGYQTVLKQGDFFLYFQNSMIVTVVSLFFILLFGAMAAFALAEYRFKGNTLMGLYLALGIMIPIRIGTVAILEMMVATGLVNTLWALILVYTAQGLPLAVFILSEFMRQVSDDLKNAGRIDGLSEYAIFFRLVLPLVRPAMATVAVFNMIPIWNDLWFPLILAPVGGGEDPDARQPGLHRAVRDRLERGAVGAVAGDPAGHGALRHLLAAADPRHHIGSGQMRVLVAGLGNMGRSHALAHHHHPDAQIVGLVNRSPVRSADRSWRTTRSSRITQRRWPRPSPTLSSSPPIPTATPIMPSPRWRQGRMSLSKNRSPRPSPTPAASSPPPNA